MDKRRLLTISLSHAESFVSPLPTHRSRLLKTTRDRVVALLRRSAQTVDDLASALGLTDNAVRSHLSALERDGIVRAEGVRRAPGAGKPPTVYELQPDADVMLSRAYAPALRAVIDAVLTELPADQGDAILRRVGHELADQAGGRARGDRNARIRAAAAVFQGLGAEVDVIDSDAGVRIQGAGCPLSSAVSAQPRVCLAVETLVADVSGEPARSCCEHGARPRCCFAIDK
jgi:predicted ArsR family transcriptional regulator